MTAQATPRVTKSHRANKSTREKNPGEDTLCAVEEYSLSDFLETEPDLYTVADIKVRYRLKVPLS
jgi:hypothetical protein